MVKGVSNVLKTKADDAIILQPLKAVIGRVLKTTSLLKTKQSDIENTESISNTL